jgi:hypothetical protein
MMMRTMMTTLAPEPAEPTSCWTLTETTQTTMMGRLAMRRVWTIGTMQKRVWVCCALTTAAVTAMLRCSRVCR